MNNLHKPFKYFSSIDEFNNTLIASDATNTKSLWGGEIQNETPEVLFEDICFIANTKKIWNRGVFYFMEDFSLPSGGNDGQVLGKGESGLVWKDRNVISTKFVEIGYKEEVKLDTPKINTNDIVTTPTSVTISWNSIEGAAKYNWECTEVNNYRISTYAALKSGTTDKTFVLIEDLTPNKLYKISIQAISDDNTIIASDWDNWEVSTEDYLHLSKPQNIFAASDGLFSTMHIKWDPVEYATWYVLSLYENGSPVSLSDYGNDNHGHYENNSIVLNKLLPLTEYTFKITPVSNLSYVEPPYDDEEVTGEITFSTDSNQLAEPVLYIIDTTYNSITVGMEEIEHAVDYIIEILEWTGWEDNWDVCDTTYVNPNATHTFDRLQFNTNYKVKLRVTPERDYIGSETSTEVSTNELPITFRGSPETDAGDICIYNYKTGEYSFIYQNEYEMFGDYNYNYRPIGVVAVPGKHNAYHDGSCAIVSLEDMHRPNWDWDDENLMYLGNNNLGDNYNRDTGLPFIEHHNSTIINDCNMYNCFMPSSIFDYRKSDGQSNNRQSALDWYAWYSYNLDEDIFAGEEFEEGYVKYTISPYCDTDVPSGKNNMYDIDPADFGYPYLTNGFKLNGQELTKLLMQNSYNPIEEEQPAYSCVTYNPLDDDEGQWYLPSIGEWGYLLARLREINYSLMFISHVNRNINSRTIYFNENRIDDGNIYTSSTPNGWSGIWCVNVCQNIPGMLFAAYEGTQNVAVRAFKRISGHQYVG